mmetsp:Transcript_2269/g.8256  ORF Transcript_2269/g.8256 Transcript_2269/m.8256 type:complete len:124 (+) Transcript_2269:84-455(+)
MAEIDAERIALEEDKAKATAEIAAERTAVEAQREKAGLDLEALVAAERVETAMAPERARIATIQVRVFGTESTRDGRLRRAVLDDTLAQRKEEGQGAGRGGSRGVGGVASLSAPNAAQGGTMP